MMDIRIAQPLDIEIIRSIAFEVWPVAYSKIISSEQIAYMLDMMYSPDSLRRQMVEEECEFLIIEEQGVAVGFSSSSMIESERFKLHKLYVLSTTQGKGCGALLLAEVCRRAKEKGGKSIELQVNKNNPAYHFYLKHGFVKQEELVLDIGNGFVMDDYILAKSLA